MKNNSLIVKNTFFLAIRTIVITLVGLYSVRELLAILGIEAYGLFNLVFGIAILFSFINGAMISSTQRYLAYYIGKQNNQLLDDAWNSSLILHFSVAIIVSLMLLGLKELILNNLLVIDLKYKNSAYFIYYCSIGSIFISIVQTPFNALILAKEKMSFFAVLSLYDAITKLGIIYCLYFFQNFVLEKYTVLYTTSSIVVFLVYYCYCFKEFNKKIQWHVQNFDLLKEMFLYSMWNVFGNLAFVAKTQGINIILNIFLGVVANSAYAITNTISAAIGGLINSIVTAINPQIYKSYAEKDFDRNILLINSASKFSFFFCFLVILPILFNTKYLLELWLHDLPLYLVSFVQVALVVMLIDSLSGSLMTGIQATGKVKIYQIVVSVSVFLNLPLSYIGIKLWNEPVVVYWVALLMSLISFGLRLYFLKSSTNFSILIYLKSVFIKLILVASSSISLAIVFSNIIYMQYEFLSFILISCAIIIGVIFSIFAFGLCSSERQFILSKINGYLK